MSKNIFALLLISFVWSTAALTQDKIIVDILPAKISTRVNMIVYSGQRVTLEYYYFFKHNYWMSFIDTLSVLDDGVLGGKKIVYNSKTFGTTVDICDPKVNSIRNAALQRRMSSQLRDVAWRDIGYDSGEITESIDVNGPSKSLEETICHGQFKVISKKWFDGQKSKVDEIRQKKIKRLEWIKANPDLINTDFIKSFLNDYGFSDIDQMAVLNIIKFNTDGFVSVCNDMPDLSFHSVTLTLSHRMTNLNTEEAIEKIKASSVKAKRKGNLIRSLKRRFSMN
ncbi:MAG: hypothetical protein QM734_07075 [Cyclobacteriaceae bacterium]